MLRLIGAVTLLAIAVLVVLTASAERDRPAAALAELDPSEKADRTAGFHCLSSWDGSLRPFREEVKAAMRNPSSFEHIGTRITPVNEDGTHLLYMTYRAENGFGGMNQGEAVAVVQNDTCSYETVTIERTIAP